MSARRRRGGPSLKIIKWRDIPAQVNGTSADKKVQVELPPRFQKAIDRAAMVAGLKDANSYIAEMGSESRTAEGDDIEGAVATLVDQGAVSWDDDIRAHVPEVPDFVRPYCRTVTALWGVFFAASALCVVVLSGDEAAWACAGRPPGS